MFRVKNKTTNRAVNECHYDTDIMRDYSVPGAQYLPESGVRGDGGVRAEEKDKIRATKHMPGMRRGRVGEEVWKGELSPIGGG